MLFIQAKLRAILVLVFVAAILTYSTLVQATQSSFSSRALEYAKQLGTNPNSVIVQLADAAKDEAPVLVQAENHLLLSLAYNLQVLPKEALDHSQHGLSLLSSKQQGWLYYYLLISQGQAYDLLGEPQRSIDLSSQAIQWAESNQHNSLLVKALVTRSLAYNTLRSPVEALSDAQRAYTLAPSEDPLIAKAQIAAVLALVYEYRRQPEKAIPYYEEAVEYHREHQRLRDLGDALYGLGQAYLNIKKIEKGKALLRESIEVARKVNDVQGIAYGLKQLAGLEFGDKKLDKAEAMFREALSIFEQSGNKYMLSDCLMWLAKLALAKEQPDTAFDYLAQAESHINIEAMPSHYYRLQLQKSEIYEEVGDYQNAYELLKQNYRDRLAMLKRQYLNKFEQLDNEFQLKQLDNENKLLEKNNQLSASILESQIKKSQYLTALISLTVVICILLVIIVIKARKSKREFEKLSLIDELTQLANRRSVFQVIKRQIDLSHRHQQEFVLALIDLDHFKQINDNYGHQLGDEVLKLFAKLCQQTLRKTDIIGRIGGEEFLIGLPQTNPSDAIKIIDNIRLKTLELVETSPKLKTLKISNAQVSISVGIAQLTKDMVLEQLFAKVDEALYQAKDSGRNQIKFVKK